MTRAMVLILCLAAAGTIAGYTHYAAQPPVEQTAVFIVPQKSPAPAKPSTPPPTAIDVPADKTALTRAIQRELKRVGCYSGEISGVWTTSSRMAMKSFVDRANAALPIDNPDAVLLSLVRNHEGLACATECPAGQLASGSGVCLTLAKAAGEPVAVTKDGAAEKAAAIALAATPATGLAAVATGSRPRDEKRPGIEAPAPAAMKPDPAASSTKMSERRARQREKANQPPKFIRDFLRTVEQTFRPR
jgi:hypothetical protein